MNKEEIDILYSFANDEDCRYVYDWQGFNYEEICPLIDKLIKESKKQKEVIDKAIEYIEKDYYSKNTFDIDNIGTTTNKLLQVRNILKAKKDKNKEESLV